MKRRLQLGSDTLFKASLGCFLIFAAVNLTQSFAGEWVGFGKFFSGKTETKASPKTARLVEPTMTSRAAKSAKTATLSPPLDVACSGNASTLVSQTGVDNSNNALGAPDATEAQLWETGDVMVLQLADLLDAGSSLNIRWRKDASGFTIPSVNVEESEDGVTFTTVAGSPFTVSATTLFDENFTSEAAVQYIRVTMANGGNLDFDAIFYVNQPCTLPTGPGNPDCVNNTEIGGILFLDANGNATQDNQEQGASGVTVKAFDADDLPASPSATTTSDTDGTYLLSGLTGGTTYRIEMSWSDAWLESSVAGGTTVQFVTAGVCDANAGVLYPAAFCQDAPDIMVPCYVNGDPLGGGSAGTMDVLVQVPYTASNTTPSPTHLLSGVDLGTVWGSALQRETQQLFLSSFLKRHCGLGTMGLGGIYKVDMSLGTPTVSNYADLETLGVDLGASQLAARDLSADATVSNYDTSAFRLVGKIGLGGLDASDDGATLWTINLYQKKLLKITIGNPAAASITAGDIQSYTLPNPGCTNGQARPWAVEEHKGVVYIGMVCSGENGGSAADLTANIYTFDPSAGTFSASPIFTFALNYPKGDVHISSTPVYDVWETWANTWSDLHEAGTAGTPAATRIMRPQPMLSDIQFDRNDNMILGLFDRNGHLTGRLNRNTTPGSTTLYNGYIGGDLLLAANSGGGVFTLESNASAGSLTGCGVGNGQGPGNGEFFCDENYSGDNDGNGTIEEIHQETFQGGLIYLAGENDLVANLIDPITFWSGGFGWFDAATGTTTQLYQIYDSGTSGATFGKANGLGLMEAFCDAAPLEIGNRVWMDTDSDGIQDPGEMGLNGVTVKLFLGGVEIASTTTAGGGSYGFSNAASGSASGFAYNISQLVPNTDYEIRILNAEGGSQQASLSGKSLTTADNGGGDAQADLRDSDGSLSGTTASVSFTSGNSGENRHDFDFGFNALCSITVVSASPSACNPVTNNYTVGVYVTYANPPSGGLTINGQTFTPDGSGSETFTLTGLTSDGSTGIDVSAAFVSDASCADTLTDAYNAPASCSFTQDPCSSGNLGGVVWSDFDADGVRDATETSEISGVTVQVYDCAGNLLGSDVTDVYGDWYVSGISGYPVRVEFSGLPGWANSTGNGVNSSTTVQFVDAASCNVDLGLQSPADYCQANPELIVPCYESGTGTGNLNPAFVSFSSANSGFSPTPDMDIATQDIGSVWGTAYQRITERVFVSAFLKRHVGLGPRGMDGIYVLDYASATPVLLGGFDLQGVVPANGGAAIDLGSVNRSSVAGAISAGAAGDYQLSNDRTEPSRDLDAFAKVGLAGYGDIDLSEDGNTLWLVNQNQRALISVDVSNLTPSSSNPNTLSSSLVNQYPLEGMTNVPVCVNGELRPFGLKIHNGRGYLGCVCDASVSGSNADLVAYVLSFDPANPTSLTVETQFDLDYPRENFTHAAEFYPDGNGDGDYDIYYSQAYEWQSWKSAWDPLPQPVISDIEFDAQGNMTLGLTDRMGNQAGNDNYTAESGSTTLYDYVTVGDILRLCRQSGGWVMECSDNDTNGTLYPFGGGGSSSDGPSGAGEFFSEDYFYNHVNQYTEVVHWETTSGALVYLPGSNEIVSTVFDPNSSVYGGALGDDTLFRTQGIRVFNSSTGGLNRSYQIVPSANNATYFGKANGLGDLEALCAAAPKQIGNFVWIDTDQDGVQDPCEDPLPGVTVQLYKMSAGSASLVATTTTGSNGEYYFTDHDEYGGFDTLMADAMYFVVLGGSGQWSTGTQQLTAGGSQYQLTTSNTGEGANPDLNDSDAFIVSDASKPFDGFPVDTVTIGDAGYVNHTLDFGLACINPDISAANPAAACSPSTVDLASITVNDVNSTTGDLSYFASAADAADSTNALASTVVSASGSFWIRKTTSLGCWDTVQVSVTINLPTAGSQNYDGCAGDGYSVTVNGTEYNEGNPTGTEVLTNSVNCDSTVTINLVFKPNASGSLSASICDGDSYLFDGQNLTSAGAYTDTLAAANGCDSVVTLTLTVLPNASSSLSASICDGDSYLFDGQNLTSAGTYTDTLTAANGCDSVVTLTLTVRAIPSSVSFSNAAPTCIGATANNDGSIILSATANADRFGVSTLNAANYDGANYASATVISLPDTVQAGIPNTGGTYIVRLFNGDDACFMDTTVTIAPVTCSCPVDITVLSPTICDPWSNHYFVDVTVSYNNPAAEQLNVNGTLFTLSGSSGSEVLQIGPFNSNGSTGNSVTAFFTPSNNCSATDTYAAPADCSGDPIGYIFCKETGKIITGGIIDVTGPGTVTITLDGSNGTYQWYTNGTPGIYTMTYTPPAGYTLSTTCTALPTLDPTGQTNPYSPGGNIEDVGNPGFLTSNACTPFHLAFNLEFGDPLVHLNNLPLNGCCTLTASGLASVQCDDNGTNANETDDFITFDLNPTGLNTAGTYNVSVNNGSISPTSGAYGMATTFSLQNGSAGAGDETLTITDDLDGNCSTQLTITDPGTCSTPCSITVTGAIPSACNLVDNTYSLDVSVTYALEPSGDLTINGQTFTPDGSGSETFTLTGLTSDGALDVDVLAAFVNDAACMNSLADAYDAPASCVCSTVNTPLSASICDGDSYVFAGQNLTSAGTYTDTLTAANGCDSVVTLTLTILPNAATGISASICDGDSYVFAGQNLTSAGTYTDTLTAANGCDSVLTLTLTVLPLPNAGSDVTLVCVSGASPDQYDFNQNGNWSLLSQPAGAAASIAANGLATGLTLPGDYIFQLEINGCTDSVKVTKPDCSLPCSSPNCLPVTVTKN